MLNLQFMHVFCMLNANCCCLGCCFGCYYWRKILHCLLITGLLISLVFVDVLCWVASNAFFSCSSVPASLEHLLLILHYCLQEVPPKWTTTNQLSIQLHTAAISFAASLKVCHKIVLHSTNT